MNILAIDPGNVESAFTVYAAAIRKVVRFAKVSNQKLLDNLHYLCTTYSIDAIYIEGVQSYGMPVGKDVFETAYMVGRIYERIQLLELEAPVVGHIIHRSDVKMFWCKKTAHVKDSNIIVAVVDFFDPQRTYGRFGKGTKKEPGPLFDMSKDCWSSTAIAIMGASYEKDRRANKEGSSEQ